jgi:hypothetical protein
MLLALIFTACLAIGILLRLILVEYKNDDCTFFAQVSFMLVGVVGLIWMGTVILCSHISAEEIIVKNQIEYESIIDEVHAVDSNNEDVSKVQVIKDVKEWNQDVHSSKYWASNPWTNWCYSQKVVNDMKYIKIPEWDIESPDGGENE